jgi:sulfate permease, SulP family
MARATQGLPTPLNFAGVGREILAGFALVATAVPSCLAAGVLAFAPLGPDYVAAGVAAGLCCAIFAAPAAAFVARTPWLVPSPRSSTAVIQASLLAMMWRQPGFADPKLCIAALGLCILLAGIIQILFGLGGVARIVKFTPHPVLAGFLNGVALLLCVPQLGRYVDFGSAGAAPNIVHPLMLVFMLGLAGVTMWGRKLVLKVPGALLGLGSGIVLFYAVKALFPAIDLGATMGAPGMTFLPPVPILMVTSASVVQKLGVLMPNILLTSLSIAIVATFDTLLTLRIVQKQAERPIHPVRDLVAQGVGNCIAACTGGLAAQLSPNVVLNAYRSGGRTMLTPLAGAALLLAIVVGMSPALAAIPVVVLQATVFANGVSSFDRWSLRMLFDTLINRGRVARRHAWHDLLVVLVVMGITASGAIIAGVLAGAALACIIFIANMSRPIFRRVYRGNEIMSKRMRPADAAAILLETGGQRIVLELQGVLFFGNADDLADRIVGLFAEVDMVTLDIHGITDIDISGAQVLHEIVANARRREKWLIICAVPPDIMRTVGELPRAGGQYGAMLLPDLDSAIEWMEEEQLRRHAAGRAPVTQLELRELDLMRGLTEEELALVRAALVPRAFARGDVLCREGEAADRLWLLTRGTVSVRVAVPGREPVRIASLAMGTVVGEMALLAASPRSATVTADEEVGCYELEDGAVRALFDEHPRLAGKILRNLAREMARRVRITSEYLRNALA